MGRWLTAILMNALECRTLTATCMHDSCVYSMAHCVCLFNIRSIELHTLHLNMVMVESVHDLGVGGRAPGYVTIQTESFCDIPKLNYALESHCLFTLSLH